jgi:hypothetical protein
MGGGFLFIVHFLEYICGGSPHPVNTENRFHPAGLKQFPGDGLNFPFRYFVFVKGEFDLEPVNPIFAIHFLYVDYPITPYHSALASLPENLLPDLSIVLVRRRVL